MSAEDHIPEYPTDANQPDDLEWVMQTASNFPLTEHVPYPERTLAEQVTHHREFEVCYLDSKETIVAPNIHSYEGTPQRLARPVIGSYDAIGLRENVCFDRLGRLGPYGLGNSGAVDEAGGAALSMYSTILRRKCSAV